MGLISICFFASVIVWRGLHSAFDSPFAQENSCDAGLGPSRAHSPVAPAYLVFLPPGLLISWSSYLLVLPSQILQSSYKCSTPGRQVSPLKSRTTSHHNCTYVTRNCKLTDMEGPREHSDMSSFHCAVGNPIDKSHGKARPISEHTLLLFVLHLFLLCLTGQP